MVGTAGQSAYSLLPVAMLSARLVSILYALIPQVRMRQVGKGVVAGIIAVFASCPGDQPDAVTRYNGSGGR